LAEEGFSKIRAHTRPFLPRGWSSQRSAARTIATGAATRHAGRVPSKLASILLVQRHTLERRAEMANDTVDTLNSFLRGEISAVETYRQAIEKLRDNPEASTLSECLRSHEQRVSLLSNEIRMRGGEPARGSGAWGAFAKLLEGGAKLFGAKAAIAALEEGEDHGRDDYKRDAPKLEPDARAFVQQQILPEQLRTHQAMSTLKKRLDTAA
jgi:demethoxyubiquinone hydroxylase (CLK1/Coq7/Cat5 family)